VLKLSCCATRDGILVALAPVGFGEYDTLKSDYAGPLTRVRRSYVSPDLAHEFEKRSFSRRNFGILRPTRRVQIALAVLVLAAAGGIGWPVLREFAPRYGGKPLHVWLADFDLLFCTRPMRMANALDRLTLQD